MHPDPEEQFVNHKELREGIESATRCAAAGCINMLVIRHFFIISTMGRVEDRSFKILYFIRKYYCLMSVCQMDSPLVRQHPRED